ncbi:hypothetical protein CAPTEDRAFT_213306 [Capitella teleta]|uniref:TIR domain-containing protein n=1 Tax=Capitella teleta TaxID=283909 RepID=R7UWU1_CAPTE|nr:hypothetical protein CAPTEDRAFT_213306 [Capitella teleta]|eukprot:ELU08397.1 hypothetical protein CAPTEDRAFT_213306 [Capitella teleta]
MLPLTAVIRLCCGTSISLPLEAASNATELSNQAVLHERDEYEIKRLIEEYVPGIDDNPGTDVVPTEQEKEEEEVKEDGGGGSNAENSGTRGDALDPSRLRDADLLGVYPHLKSNLRRMTDASLQLIKLKMSAETYHVIHETLLRDFEALYDDCVEMDQRRLLAYHAAKISFDKIAKQIYAKCIDVQSEDGNTRSGAKEIQPTIQNLIWKFSSCNKKFANKLGRNGFIEICFNQLQKNLKRNRHDEGLSALAILYTCARTKNNADEMIRLNVQKVLIDLATRQPQNTDIRIASVLIVCCLNESISSLDQFMDAHLRDAVVGILQQAFMNNCRMHSSYSLSDLLNYLQLLTTTNDKKTGLCSVPGFVDLMRAILSSKRSVDREQAALLIWSLAFGKNASALRADKQLLQILDEISESSPSWEEKWAVDGAMYRLKEQLTPGEFAAYEIDSDVFISAHKNDESIASKIQDSFKDAEIRVGGCVESFGSRVRALRGSRMVLAVLSPSFVRSAQCRTEIELAISAKKELLGLRFKGIVHESWMSSVDMEMVTTVDEVVERLTENL